MSKNKLLFYLIGIAAGMIIFSAGLGMLVSFYQQKSRLKSIIKAKYQVYLNNKITKPIPDLVSDTNDKEIHIFVDASKDIGKINPLLYGSNISAQIETDQAVIELVKNIGITCVRFPGGTQGYHWKDRIFDFEPRYIDTPLNDINYLVEFCKKTNTKLIMQVNVESGTAKEAAGLVEYLNKKLNFKVEYWELGNEVYGDWDKGFMSSGKYAEIIKEYVAEMKKIDPDIKIGMDWAPENRNNFNIEVIRKAGNYIDFISYHWYPNHVNATHMYDKRIHPTPEEVMANYLQIPVIVNNAKKLFEKYVPNKKDNIEINFLEWDGAWDGPSSDLPPYSQGVVQWSLANAIFHADCLGMFAANNVAVSAQYNLQSTGFGFIRGWDKNAGWGGQRWDGEIVRPKAFAVQLFSRHFGDILVKSKVENSPEYYKIQDWRPDSYTGIVPYITCYASKSSVKGTLVLVLINKHSTSDYKAQIKMQSIEPKNEGKLFVLSGQELISQNEGQPLRVRIKEYKVQNVKKEFHYTIPAHSVNFIEIEPEG